MKKTSYLFWQLLKLIQYTEYSTFDMLAVLHVIPFPMQSICRIRQVMSSYKNISNIFVIHTCSNGRIVKISGGRLPVYVY